MTERTPRAARTLKPSGGPDTRLVPRDACMLERFFARVDTTAPRGCWPWRGNVHRTGYGWFSLHGQRHRLAHRVAWELVNGPIPDGLMILHSCDNPVCVRPGHLRAGTGLDNVADKLARGRQPSKLTAAQVIRIRELAARRVPYWRLAEQYRVTEGAIRLAVQRRTWRHI